MEYRGIEINELSSKYLEELEYYLSLPIEGRRNLFREWGKEYLKAAHNAIATDSVPDRGALEKYKFIRDYLRAYRKASQNA